MSSMTEPLILAPSLSLVPVAELPESLRSQFEWSDGDVAVTRLRSRTPSKIIDSAFARLLDEFRSEKTVVEAIMHYSLLEAADPRQTLEEAYPILQQFVGQGLLVSPDAASGDSEMPHLRGERIDDFAIVNLVRSLQDSEVYQARGPSGETVAIKVKKDEAGPVLDLMLEQEASILRLLNGQNAPRFLTSGTVDGRPYLAMSWCPGTEITHAAAELAPHRERLLDLCIAVLDAYATLHAAGVMHGDIHPGNILVDGHGQVTIIDFGLAETEGLPAPYRGGVPFYYEPEYAAAFLARRKPPRANAAAEQYALGALLYQLTAGASYTNFSLEEEVLYRQIVEDEPLPFSAHGREAWPEVEAILSRALAKDPARRFPDVAAFAEALRSVAARPEPIELPEVTHSLGLPVVPSGASQTLLDDILAQLQLDGDLLRDGLPRSPYASVNFGAGGVAYALYRLAMLREKPELLALADVWLSRAETAAGDPAGFYNPELEMDEETIGPVSLFHTPSGLAAVRVLLAGAMGDLMSQMEAVSRLAALAGQPTELLDVTLGKAGILLIGALAVEKLRRPEWAAEFGLQTLGDQVQDELWATLDGYRPIGPQCQLGNLGIAHGWAGMLYGTLRWHEATGRPLPANLTRRLDELAALAEDTRRGVRWLWEYGAGEASMSGWCNGSAGYVYLWTLAGRLLDDARYDELAERAAWHAWEDPARFASLCCGLAGRAYSLLQRYQSTGDTRWLERAQYLGREAAYHIRHSQLPEYVGFEMSLYKGELAPSLLLADLASPETAALPFFSSERPPVR